MNIRLTLGLLSTQTGRLAWLFARVMAVVVLALMAWLIASEAKAAWQIEFHTSTTEYRGACTGGPDCATFMTEAVGKANVGTIIKDCWGPDERLAVAEGSTTCERVEFLLAQVTTAPGTPVTEPPVKEQVTGGMYKQTDTESTTTRTTTVTWCVGLPLPDAEGTVPTSETVRVGNDMPVSRLISPGDPEACADYKPVP